MTKTLIATAVALLMAHTASAEGLKESARRLTQDVQAETTTERRRSTRRTVAGSMIIAFGSVMALAVEQNCDGTRVNDLCFGEVSWPVGQIAAGAGTVVAGILLTTIWAYEDVEVTSDASGITVGW